MANNKTKLAELKIENLKLNYVIDSIINDTYEIFKMVNENWTRDDVKHLYKTRADTVLCSCLEEIKIKEKR